MTKSFSYPSLLRASNCFGLLLALGVGTVFAGADEDGDLQPVSLQDSECGSACVMVFGQVGEPFQVELSMDEDCVGSEFERGVDATGHLSALPDGLRFDREAVALRGVPARPGFHEFVLLHTERGVTTERVVLIDIQGDYRASSTDTYASYFFGGIR